VRAVRSRAAAARAVLRLAVGCSSGAGRSAPAGELRGAALSRVAGCADGGSAGPTCGGGPRCAPLFADAERDPVKDRCCHMPPRLGCALGATGVQSSREESLSRYTQINGYASPSLTPYPNCREPNDLLTKLLATARAVHLPRPEREARKQPRPRSRAAAAGRCRRSAHSRRTACGSIRRCGR